MPYIDGTYHILKTPVNPNEKDKNRNIARSDSEFKLSWQLYQKNSLFACKIRVKYKNDI